MMLQKLSLVVFVVVLLKSHDFLYTSLALHYFAFAKLGCGSAV